MNGNNRDLRSIFIVTKKQFSPGFCMMSLFRLTNFFSQFHQPDGSIFPPCRPALIVSYMPLIYEIHLLLVMSLLVIRA